MMYETYFHYNIECFTSDCWHHHPVSPCIMSAALPAPRALYPTGMFPYMSVPSLGLYPPVGYSMNQAHATSVFAFNSLYLKSWSVASYLSCGCNVFDTEMQSMKNLSAEAVGLSGSGKTELNSNLIIIIQLSYHHVWKFRTFAGTITPTPCF